MTEYRIHYLVETHTARCGLGFPRNWTIDPSNITCKTCLKLLKGEVK